MSRPLLAALLALAACADPEPIELVDIAADRGEILGLTDLGTEIVRVVGDGFETVVELPPPTGGVIDFELVAGPSQLYASRADGLYAIDGAAVTAIEGASPHDFTLVGSELYFQTADGLAVRDESTAAIRELATPPEFADAISFDTDGKVVVFSTITDLWRAQLDSTEATLLADRSSFRLFIRGSELWLSNRPAIERMPLAGGEIEQIASSGRVSRLQFDDDHVYWKTATGIHRAPTEGGASETLVDDNRLLLDFVVGPDQLVYLEGGRLTNLGNDEVNVFEAATPALRTLPL